jgi:hypothetical protein
VLFPAGILAVIPTGNRLARKRTIALSELATEALLLLRPGFATRQIIDGAFQVARIEPRVVLESGSPHCLLGEQFVEELVAYTRHTHPGRRFGRAAPPVRPPEPPKVRSGLPRRAPLISSVDRPRD